MPDVVIPDRRHYKGSQLPLEIKEAENVWDSLDDVIAVIKTMREGRWTWVKNARCKYINIRLDMRDGGVLITDREGARIDPKQLAWQYGDPDPNVRG